MQEGCRGHQSSETGEPWAKWGPKKYFVAGTICITIFNMVFTFKNGNIFTK